MGETFSTNLSNWDFAVPGSPNSKTLMSPRRVSPSGRRFLDPEKVSSSRISVSSVLKEIKNLEPYQQKEDTLLPS